MIRTGWRRRGRGDGKNCRWVQFGTVGNRALRFAAKPGEMPVCQYSGLAFSQPSLDLMVESSRILSLYDSLEAGIRFDR